jgi:hypothetical protein
MAASYSDQQFLAADPTFQNRVRQSLLAACQAIKSESPTTVPFHRERETFAVGVENGADAFKVIVAQSISTNAAVIGAATTGGTVVLNAGNVAAQAALVTDAQIDTAISTNFNSFFRTPAS